MKTCKSSLNLLNNNLINKTSKQLFATPSLSSSSSTIILDSGASGHYFQLSDSHLLQDIMPVGQTVRIHLPDSSFMDATHVASLKLPCIPTSASKVYLFPKLAGSLISVSQLCDAGLSVHFSSAEVTVLNPQNNIVLRGHRTGTLYNLQLEECIAEIGTCEANRVIRHTSQAERVAFYHAAMGSPSIPTFITAIRRGYIVLPGLSSDMIQRNLPNPIATSLGHLDALRQGLRSTKQPIVLDTEDEEDPTYIPTSDDIADTVQRGIMCREFDTSTLFADATGRFPVTSRSGTQYI